MTVINQLASALNRRDEIPNQELAIRIADNNNKEAVKELVAHLSSKNKDIQSDCIKVLYEIAERSPSLVGEYTRVFIDILENKSNRLQWGSMTVLSSIAAENLSVIYSALGKIATAAGKGSVITKDHYVKILVTLCAEKKYADDSIALLIEQLLSSPTNQLPSYAEQALPVINEDSKALFIRTLRSRLGDVESDTKRKRVEKVIAKATKSMK